MNSQGRRWEILNKLKVKSEKLKVGDIVDILLKNRRIKNKKEFFEPTDPGKIGIKELGVNDEPIKKAIKRIKQAKDRKESVIIYGDYDADGITATAIVWEALHTFGLNVLPHIPDRFEEGYGINSQSIKNLKLKIENLKLIITVDNGIVGYDGIETANKLGIDVIVVDHHTKGTGKNKAHSVIHSTVTSGAGLAWFFAKELGTKNGLELAAIGVIADQLPLTGINRSIAKYGLEELNKTKRPGLLALFEEAGIENIGVYEVGYIIAPRINAMGRLKHGLESLRLLCTKDKVRAFEIAKNIGSTNSERQKMVDQIVATTLSEMKIESKGLTNKVIVLASKNYHEGVIGLAAGRLVEEFYRPAIVLSTKGNISKASARSISGFNIIEAIRAVNLHLEGGGHPMAAGFSIETNRIDKFKKEINKLADKLLTDELLAKKLRIDCELNFNQLNYELLEKLEQFEPTGLGNPGATFMTRSVEVLDIKLVGREARHLKSKLKQNGQVFDSIFFGGGEMYSKLSSDQKVNVAYSLEDNSWNGYKNLQLKIKDLDFNPDVH
jgi:single-stranded-DNA-specific exonuclease